MAGRRPRSRSRESSGAINRPPSSRSSCVPGEDELERFCSSAQRFLTTEQGRPLVIEGFQRQILADYFDGARETVVLLSKKNGKTSLFAGIAVWHVVTVPFADVAILAASRDQA